MRDVLLQLALLSNGRTSSFEASASSDGNPMPSLGPGDDPAGYYAARWERADDDQERAAVLAEARERLEQERGHGERDRARVRVESKAERDARIVTEGAGWEA